MNLQAFGEGAEKEPKEIWECHEGICWSESLSKMIVVHASCFANVHAKISISLVQAILGGAVDVKTLTGQVKMKVPPKKVSTG